MKRLETIFRCIFAAITLLALIMIILIARNPAGVSMKQLLFLLELAMVLWFITGAVLLVLYIIRKQKKKW